MKTVKFIPTGKAVSDFEISEYVDNILISDEDEFHTSTHMVIDEIRARILEGRIGVDDLHVYVMGKEGEEYFAIDKNGRSSDWVESQKIHSDILTRLISGLNPNK